MKYAIAILMLALTACTKEFQEEEDKVSVNLERPIRQQADTVPMPIRYSGNAVMPK